MEPVDIGTGGLGIDGDTKRLRSNSLLVKLHLDPERATDRDNALQGFCARFRVNEFDLALFQVKQIGATRGIAQAKKQHGDFAQIKSTF